MNLLTGRFFKAYDPGEHTAVCPINKRYDDEKLLLKLSQIGCEVLGEIAMPIDIGVHYFHVKLPEWLKLQEATEDGNHFFTDDKGNPRMRTELDYFNHTNVWTRYRPWEFITEEQLMLPCVVDAQRVEDDEENEDNPGVIWIGPRSPDSTLIDLKAQAQQWLDTKYPNWRDPMAYWT